MNESTSKFSRPTVDEVVNAHGGLKDEGSRWVGPCPSCGGTDRFAIVKATAMIQCRGCRPEKSTPKARAAYFAILHALGLNGRRNATGHRKVAPVASTEQSKSDRERMRKTEYLYGLGIPIPGTPAQKHLAKRGITTVPSGIRYIPNARHGKLPGEHRCILAPVIDTASGKLIAVQRYYFDVQESTNRKRCTGAPMGGGVLVAGSLDDERIIVVEGLVDALSIRQCGVTGGIWAAGGKDCLSGFQLPKNAKSLVIGADRDEAGTKAAQKLACRVEKLGINVRISAPPPGMGDWNDLLNKGRHGMIRYAFRTNWEKKV